MTRHFALNGIFIFRMSNPFDHNNEPSVRDNYRPLLELARQYGYAKDYLGILARSGKIDAKKSSTGQWFALESSVREYHSNAQEKKLFLQSEAPVDNVFRQPVPSTVLFNNESSSNAKGGFSKQLNTVIVALIAWGGVFVFTFFTPTVFDGVITKTNLETANIFQTLKDGLSQLFDRNLYDAPPAVVIFRSSQPVEPVAVPALTFSPTTSPQPASPPQVITKQTFISQPTQSLTYLEQAINDLRSNFDAFSRQVPTTFHFPETNI